MSPIQRLAIIIIAILLISTNGYAQYHKPPRYTHKIITKNLGLVKFRCLDGESKELGMELADYTAAYFYSDQYQLLSHRNIPEILATKFPQNTIIDPEQIRFILRNLPRVDALLLGEIRHNQRRWKISYRILSMDTRFVASAQVSSSSWFSAKRLFIESLLTKVNLFPIAVIIAKEFDNEQVLQELLSTILRWQKKKRLKILLVETYPKGAYFRLLLTKTDIATLQQYCKIYIPRIRVERQGHRLLTIPW